MILMAKILIAEDEGILAMTIKNELMKMVPVAPLVD